MTGKSRTLPIESDCCCYHEINLSNGDDEKEKNDRNNTKACMHQVCIRLPSEVLDTSNFVDPGAVPPDATFSFAVATKLSTNRSI